MDDTISDAIARVAPQGGWQAPARRRLVPVPPAKQRRWQRAVMRFLVKREQVPASNLFATLLHAPGLFLGWLGFASRLMPYGNLSRRHTELVILRVAWKTRCAYEWRQHLLIGRSQGLGEQDVLRLMAGPTDPGWNRIEATLLQTVDVLMDEGRINDGLWADLAATFSRAQCVELVMLVGHYRMLAGVIDNLGIELE